MVNASRGRWMLVMGLALGCGDSGGNARTGTDDTGTTEDPPTAASTGTGTTASEPDGTGTTAPSDDTSSDTTGEPPWDGLLAGVAVRYLDRPVGIPMAGYGNRTGGVNTPWTGLFSGSRGFHGLPTIKVIAFESEGEQLVLIKSPLMSAESGLTDALVAEMRTEHGRDLAGRIISGATHSHHVHARYWRLPDQFSAVGADSSDEEVIDLLATELGHAVEAALEDLGPAQWSHAHVEDWDPADRIYSDRRHVNDFEYGKDPRLSLLAVQRPDGTPMATIVNFGMHGTLLGASNELITEDAAGGLEMVLEERFYRERGEPTIAMFMQAGGGDAAPEGGALGHGGIARAEMIGHEATPAILELYDELQWRDEARIDVHSQRVDLTWEFFGYDRSDEFYGAPLGVPLPLPYTWGGWQCTSPSAPDDDDPATSMEGELKECYPVDILLLGNVPHGEAHQSYLTTARLDELFLVTMPGEPTYSVMRYLREQVAARSTPEQPAEVMGIGYAQDHLLYLTHPDDWFQGGYEAEMAWLGPFAGRTFVDTQVEVIDRMRAGEDLEPFVEQSPALIGAEGFTPRGVEISLDAGALLEDVVTDMMRTETVRMRFGAGDPTLGAPRVVVQVDPGDGSFVDVPSPAGWEGAALDNTRYDMITHYDPVPEPDGFVAASRQHEWYVDWEIPADFPAGIYRLVARGPVWNGVSEVEVEVASSAFAIGRAQNDALEVERVGDVLELRWVLPAVTPATEESWPSAGWRVHDREVGPSDPITVRVPLTLSFVVDGAEQPGRHTIAFDEAADAHVFDLSDAGLGGSTGALVVRAHVADDVDPDPIEEPVP